MTTTTTQLSDVGIWGIQALFENDSRRFLSETQIKGIIISASLTEGIDFAARLASGLHMRVDSATFRLARQAAWDVGGLDATSGLEALKQPNSESGIDYLLYAMCAAFIGNYRYFPLLKSDLAAQLGRGRGTALIDAALDLATAVHEAAENGGQMSTLAEAA